MPTALSHAGPPAQLREALASRYHVGDVLGEGATAIVFKAHDLKHGRDVAIKMLRPAVAATVGAERFLSEIRIAASLSHPHILALYDSGAADGLLYFVMPYVDGESLRQRLTRDRQLSLEEAVRITRDLSSGLQHAHDHGIVHRDVKPENILLAPDVACIADFGLATAMRGVSVGRLTAEGLAVGTVAYMSPEQAGGDEPDGRSDQYSLACVLYEMLAGIPPYHGVNAHAVVARHRSDPPPQLRHVRPTVPVAFDEAVSRAMAKLPADRFQSVGAFVQALEAAVTANMLATRGSNEHRFALDAGGATGRVRGIPERRSMVWMVFGVSVALTAALAGYLTFGRDHGVAFAPVAPDMRLDANRLAVAPFMITRAGDSLWANGLADLLSRNFDGAGPLRTVWATLAIRAWEGRSDRMSALKVAQRTGAGLVLVGQLVPAGNDSSRITATLVDARTGEDIGEVDIRDESSRVERMADSLTVQLLRELGRVRAIAAVPRSSIGSRSLGALKAFLQGEQYYRANEMTAARDAYERAIALDSSFTLAYRRMRSVLRAIGSGQESDPLSFQYALKSGVRNRGLSPRDSLLILADSLAAAFSAISPIDGVALGLLRRRLTVLDQSVASYPDDPEGWYELGEFRYHYGERFGLSQEQALDAFERSTQIDSAFAPGYYHLIALAPNLRGAAAARRLTLQYLTTNPGDARMRLVATLLDTSRATSPERQRLLDTVPSATLSAAGIMLRRWADPQETARHLFERQLGRKDLSTSERQLAEQLLSLTLLYRGHARESLAKASLELLDAVPIALVSLAEYDVVPRDTIRSFIFRWAHGSDLRRLLAVLPLASDVSDTASIRLVTTRCDSVITSHQRPPTVPAHALYCARAGRAYLHLARGDSSAAVREFSTLPDTLCQSWCSRDRTTAARLLAWSGKPREAATVLDRSPPLAVTVMISEVAWALERARLASRLGDTTTARRLDAFVRAAWISADSEVIASMGDVSPNLPGQRPGVTGTPPFRPRR